MNKPKTTIMSPKERGNLLVNKFYNLHAWEVMELDKRKIEYDISKQAAIICVEQIIEAVGTIEDQVYEWDRRPAQDFNYWKEVLEHLKSS